MKIRLRYTTSYGATRGGPSAIHSAAGKSDQPLVAMKTTAK